MDLSFKDVESSQITSYREGIVPKHTLLSLIFVPNDDESKEIFRIFIGRKIHLEIGMYLDYRVQEIYTAWQTIQENFDFKETLDYQRKDRVFSLIPKE